MVKLSPNDIFTDAFKLKKGKQRSASEYPLLEEGRTTGLVINLSESESTL